MVTGASGTVEFSEIEHIMGGQGEDTIDASASTVGQILGGGEGSETLTGGCGDDIIAMGQTQDFSATDGDRDSLVLTDGFGNDTIEGFEVPDFGDGTAIDQLDVSGLTSDGGTTPVVVDDVVVSDTNGDGTGDAILTFPGGESISLLGVDPTDVDRPAELEAIGIPAAAPALNYIVEGDGTANLIDASYTGDPEGDQIDNSDALDGSQDDSVLGGAGDDTLVLDTFGGSNTVTGFSAPTDTGGGRFSGNDLLDVTGLLDFDGNATHTGNVTVTEVGGNAVLTFPNGESLTLVGVPAADVSTPAQLIAMGIPEGPDGYVDGAAGDDTIIGGEVDDAVATCWI